MGDPWVAVVTVVVALLGAGGVTGYLGNRLTNRTTRENNFMDQQQEDNDSLRQRNTLLEWQVMRWRDYAELLRRHISDGQGPPPPPYPNVPGRDE